MELIKKYNISEALKTLRYGSCFESRPYRNYKN